MEGISNLRCPSPKPIINAALPLGEHPKFTTGLVEDDGKSHVLVAATGGSSILKLRDIVHTLSQNHHITVNVVLTSTAAAMLGDTPLQGVKTWVDSDEWKLWGNRNDPVLHIELRRWADILVVAPLTANTLAKISLGVCDNLLTNVIRAWNTQRPIVLAPCMLPSAYNHQITRRHLKTIREEMPWITVLKPSEKVVGPSGEIGLGGMIHWEEIVSTVVSMLHLEQEDADSSEEDDDDDDGDDDDDEEEDE